MWYNAADHAYHAHNSSHIEQGHRAGRSADARALPNSFRTARRKRAGRHRASGSAIRPSRQTPRASRYSDLLWGAHLRGPQRFCVLACETGGCWNDESLRLCVLRALAPFRGDATQGWYTYRPWWRLLSVFAAICCHFARVSAHRRPNAWRTGTAVAGHDACLLVPRLAKPLQPQIAPCSPVAVACGCTGTAP